VAVTELISKLPEARSDLFIKSESYLKSLRPESVDSEAAGFESELIKEFPGFPPKGTEVVIL
jgi:hypothetical protein